MIIAYWIMILSPIIYFLAPLFAKGWRSLIAIIFVFGFFLAPIWIDAIRIEMNPRNSQSFLGILDRVGFFILTTIYFIAGIVLKAFFLWLYERLEKAAVYNTSKPSKTGEAGNTVNPVSATPPSGR